MKTVLLLVGALLLSLPCLAMEPVETGQDTLAGIGTKVTSIEKEITLDKAETQQRLNALEKKVVELSNKLGTSFGGNTIERRLTDIERRLTKVEKDMDRLSRLEKDLEQLKNRVSKVESKK